MTLIKCYENGGCHVSEHWTSLPSVNEYERELDNATTTGHRKNSDTDAWTKSKLTDGKGTAIEVVEQGNKDTVVARRVAQRSSSCCRLPSFGRLLNGFTTRCTASDTVRE